MEAYGVDVVLQANGCVTLEKKNIQVHGRVREARGSNRMHDGKKSRSRSRQDPGTLRSLLCSDTHCEVPALRQGSWVKLVVPPKHRRQVTKWVRLYTTTTVIIGCVRWMFAPSDQQWLNFVMEKSVKLGNNCVYLYEDIFTSLDELGWHFCLSWDPNVLRIDCKVIQNLNQEMSHRLILYSSGECWLWSYICAWEYQHFHQHHRFGHGNAARTSFS